ncbi:MAG: RhuM family protein [Alphaproteobacteria bacterium]|nr:RhuM family protein [Alphaproteobacteria bacterium]
MSDTVVKKMTENKDITLFTSSDGEVSLNVPLDKETVWLSLKQMSELFGRDKSVISRHIKKVFDGGELLKQEVVAYFATTAADGKQYQVEYFNIDVVLSVGYRVNSKRGSEFRRWSNNILKKYILDGFAFNHAQLSKTGLKTLNQSITLIKSILSDGDQKNDFGSNALSIIESYAKSWSILLSFDENKLASIENVDTITEFDLKKVKDDIDQFKVELIKKGEATELFGNLRSDVDVDSVFDSVHQTFDGVPLYQSLEERAAHVLYFFVKNHIFFDGNKRIGSFIFLIYLSRCFYEVTKIANETLVALALLVARSHPSEKETIIQLIMHLIKR